MIIPNHEELPDLRAYRVLLTPDYEGGGYLVRVPAFPAISTQGDDVSDALAMAESAITSAIASARENGLPSPPPDANNEVLVETIVIPALYASY